MSQIDDAMIIGRPEPGHRSGTASAPDARRTRAASPIGSAAASGGSLADLWGSARRRRLWIVASACLAAALGALYALHQTPSYRATVEILIDPQAQQIVGRGLRPDTPAQLDFASLDSQPLILLSSKLLGKTIARLDLTNDPVLTRNAPAGADRTAVALDGLRRRTTVRRVETSLVFQLTVAYPEPRRAAEIANAIAATYFEVAAEDRLAAVRRANDTLLTQLADLRGQLDRADLAVERYRTEKGLIASGDAGLLVSQQLRDLYGQITASEANLAKLAGRREQARQLENADATMPATPEAGASQVMISLRAQHAQNTQEIAQLSRSLGQNHPQMLALSAQRAATARLIAAEADRIRRTIDEDVRRGEESLRTLRRRAETLISSQTSSNEEGIRLRQLESDADAIRRTYNLVLSRSKDLEQQEVINPNNSQVVSVAGVPLKPSDTPLPIVVAAAGLFGAVLGLIASYLYDRCRGTFTTSAALGSAGVPVWARVPPRVRGRPTGPAEDQALVAAARELRARLAGRAWATVTVAAEGLGAERMRTAQVLTDLLTRLGEPTLLLSGTPRIRHEPAVGPGIAGTLRERPDASRRQKVVVIERDVSDGENWLAIPETSDAIVLVVDPDRTTRGRLESLIALLDGTGRFRQDGLLGIVAVQPARAGLIRLPRLARGRFAVRPA